MTMMTAPPAAANPCEHATLGRYAGVDTHRDTHQVEIALPNGAPIALTAISNDSTGYAELLAWIVDHAPGPG